MEATAKLRGANNTPDIQQRDGILQSREVSLDSRGFLHIDTEFFPIKSHNAKHRSISTLCSSCRPCMPGCIQGSQAKGFDVGEDGGPICPQLSTSSVDRFPGIRGLIDVQASEPFSVLELDARCLQRIHVRHLDFSLQIASPTISSTILAIHLLGSSLLGWCLGPDLPLPFPPFPLPQIE